ncbi:LysR substrate-binding domain-containing protein, partial [Burkholderia stabilis]
VGASEDFAGAWLPHVLRTFRDLDPRTSIELKVGITASLLREQALGRLDVVFGKQCRQVDTPGELLWEEPLVWAFASDRALDADGEVPLALFPEPCVYREAAVSALAAALRPFRVLFESSTVPAACSSRLMWPLTADGVSARRSAAGAKPRLSTTSRKVRSSAMSSELDAGSVSGSIGQFNVILEE